VLFVDGWYLRLSPDTEHQTPCVSGLTRRESRFSHQARQIEAQCLVDSALFSQSMYKQLGVIGPIQYRTGHIELPTIQNSGTIVLAYGNAPTP
jgi:hypothetical protein